MAPFPLPTTNATTSSGTPSPRPVVPCHQPVNQNQNQGQSQWGPDSISNIVFGLVMVFISLFAIYQSRRERLRGLRAAKEEEEDDDDVQGEVVVNTEDKVAASGSSAEERVMEREMLECVGKDNDDGEGALPRVGGFTRTNTEVTLVDGAEGSEELALKGCAVTVC